MIESRTPVNSIQIPIEFASLASMLYDGQASMLYAVASTGNLTTGSIRPYDHQEHDYYTDEQWYVYLWSQLEIELYQIVCMIEEGRIKDDEDIDANEVVRFHEMVETTEERLRKEYGLEDW